MNCFPELYLRWLRVLYSFLSKIKINWMMNADIVKNKQNIFNFINIAFILGQTDLFHSVIDIDRRNSKNFQKYSIYSKYFKIFRCLLIEIE